MRIHFTPADLLRVRFADEPAPLLELGLALAGLHRPHADPVFTRWRRETLRALPPRARALLELIPPCGRGPMFLDPMTPDIEEGLDAVASASASANAVRAELARVVGLGQPITPLLRDLAAQDRDTWRELVTVVAAAHGSVLMNPGGTAWRRLRAGFHAEVAWRTSQWGRLGIGDALIAAIPGARWVAPTAAAPLVADDATMVLELAPERAAEWLLDGRGLTLYPSPLWTGSPMVGNYTDGSKLLVYPALTPLPLLDEPQATGPLATLLGRTRAQVLEALAEQRTTSRLARELGISLASASQHATALREAGLVATRRDGKAAWHGTTALGAALLRSGVR